MPTGTTKGSSAWIGTPITPLQVAAMLTMGVISVCGMALTPLLLGALVQEGRLTTAGLGSVATTEMLATGITSIAATSLRPVGLRWWGGCASLALLILDLAMGHMSGSLLIMANRAAAGVAEGVLYWLLACMVIRSCAAERWSGISLTLMTVVPLLLAVFLPLTVMRTHGASGGYVALAILSSIGIIVSLMLPRSLIPLAADPADGPVSGVVPLRGITALASAFLFQTCIVSTWAYLQPLSALAHHPAETIAIAVACGLGAQVIGSISAAVTAHRLPFGPVLAIGFLILFGSVTGVLALPAPAIFVLTIIVFAFLSQFLIPYELSLTIAADPSRRSALLMSPIQMLGGAAGPLLASLAMVAGGTAKDAAGVSLIALGLAMALAFFAYVRRSRVARPPIAT